MEKGLSTGITYRRRDTDNGNGDNDNGVWIDFSFPIWKASKKKDTDQEKTMEYVTKLEQRIARLEAMYDAVLARHKQNKDSDITYTIVRQSAAEQSEPSMNP